jgi:hypothetical protein
MDLTTAPWWGVPLIAGAFLVIGALLSYVLTNLNDRRREQREDSKKWHDQLRSEAAQLISLAHQIALEGPALQEAREGAKATEGTEPEEKIDALNTYLEISDKVVAMMTELYLINSTIKLIAPPEVSSRSESLANAAGTVMSEHTTIRSDTLDSKVELFLQEVRYALGIDVKS